MKIKLIYIIDTPLVNHLLCHSNPKIYPHKLVQFHKLHLSDNIYDQNLAPKVSTKILFTNYKLFHETVRVLKGLHSPNKLLAYTQSCLEQLVKWVNNRPPDKRKIYIYKERHTLIVWSLVASPSLPST